MFTLCYISKSRSYNYFSSSIYLKHLDFILKKKNFVWVKEKNVTWLFNSYMKIKITANPDFII